MEIWENKIYHRYIDENGNRKHQFIDNYAPCLYKESEEKIDISRLKPDNTKFKKNIFNVLLEKVEYEKMREFYKDRKSDDGFYGHDNIVTQFIYDNYGMHGDISFDIKKFNIMNFDIETESDPVLGFPNYNNPINEVISISTKMFHHNNFVTFGLKDYVKQKDSDIYIKCDDEYDLLIQFIRYVHSKKVDIFTGFNIKEFDFNYLISRAKKVVGDKINFISQYYNPDNPNLTAKEPLKFIKRDSKYTKMKKAQAKEQAKKGRKGKKVVEVNLVDEEEPNFKTTGDEGYYRILGSSICDYYDILDKFFTKNLGNRKLNTFAEYFGVGLKVDYVKKYGSLHRFYKENFQDFIMYNEQDVNIIDLIDERTNYIFILINIAYMSRSKIDAFAGTIAVWENYINMEFLNKGYVIPFRESVDEIETPNGAWVKDPLVQIFKWVATLDVESLYPTMLIMFNISPETLLDESQARYDNYKDIRDAFIKVHVPYDDLVEKYFFNRVVENKYPAFFESLKPIDPSCTITPNNVKTVKAVNGKLGILPEIVADIIDKRRVAKAESKRNARIYEKCVADGLQETIEAIEANKLKLQYYGMEQAQKILINSLYGALLNKTFRFFNLNLGEAITAGGRLYIQSINAKVNQLLNDLLNTKDVDYVIYTDTDSHFLNFEMLVENVFKMGSASKDEIVDKIDDFIESVIEPFYNRCFESLSKILNTSVNRINMKREKIADVALFRAKKNYAIRVIDNEGTRYANPKINYTGLENIKGGTPKFFKDAISRSVELFFDGEEDEFIDYCNQIRDDYKELPIFDIASSSRVNGVEKVGLERKGAQLHLRGTWKYNEYLESNAITSIEPVRSGESVQYVTLKRGLRNTFHSNVISFREESDIDMLKLDKKIVDYDLEFSKKFDIIEGLANIVGWNTSRYNQQKYNSLEW